MDVSVAVDVCGPVHLGEVSATVLRKRKVSFWPISELLNPWSHLPALVDHRKI